VTLRNNEFNFLSLINVNCEKNISATNSIIHDVEVVTKFAETLSGVAHQFELKESHDPMDQGEFLERVYRLVYLVMGKKLSTSFDPEAALAYKGLLSRVASMEIYGPSAMMPMINMFGYVDEKDQSWKVHGQAALALTYACRGLCEDTETTAGVEQIVNRNLDYFVNNRWNRPFNPLLELVTGIVNSWAQSAESYQVMVGNLPLELKPPQIARGFAAYRGFTAGAPNKPAKVVWAISVGELIETLHFNRADGRALAADLPAFNLLNVKIVDWRSEDYSTRAEDYYHRVQFRLQGAFDRGFTWVPISGMTATGTLAQLVKLKSHGGGTSPYGVPGGAIEFGWMMCGEHVGYYFNNDSYIVRGDASKMQKMISYIEGMARGRKQ